MQANTMDEDQRVFTIVTRIINIALEALYPVMVMLYTQKVLLNSKIPDIIVEVFDTLTIDKDPVMVIELKRRNISQNNNEHNQLKGYMKNVNEVIEADKENQYPSILLKYNEILDKLREIRQNYQNSPY
ncbi:hypothetical protein AYI70_g11962 [Smittium culicis]|uniref:Uncharacterized protein n=1 Tax=Smittium culicis TaxID=133412 RepID=A0A1R1WZI8_9FUNG|nr:hypothetical protein AYI70_g11962 [Smittium culicis]